MSAARPSRVVPPLLNRYGLGMAFGDAIDNAIRGLVHIAAVLLAGAGHDRVRLGARP